jgi:hypothetical protein
LLEGVISVQKYELKGFCGKILRKLRKDTIVIILKQKTVKNSKISTMNFLFCNWWEKVLNFETSDKYTKNINLL